MSRETRLLTFAFLHVPANIEIAPPRVTEVFDAVLGAHLPTTSRVETNVATAVFIIPMHRSSGHVPAVEDVPAVDQSALLRLPGAV